MLIDAHCHLEEWIRKEQLETLLQATREQGVGGFVTIGTRVEDVALYDSSVKNYPCIRFSAGIHPTEIADDFKEQLATLKPFLKTALAVGEIGLDFHQLPNSKQERVRYAKRQIQLFDQQLQWAQEANLPIIIHCREAFEVLVEVLQYRHFDWMRVVFHCFSETPQAAQFALEKGAYLSYCGNITYKNAQIIRESADITPLDRILVETDCPFLTPVPHRGKPNSPVYLPHTAHFIADLKGVDYETFCQMTVENTQRFFRYTWPQI